MGSLELLNCCIYSSVSFGGEEKEAKPLLAKKHQIRCQWRMGNGWVITYLKFEISSSHSKRAKSNHQREDKQSSNDNFITSYSYSYTKQKKGNLRYHRLQIKKQ